MFPISRASEGEDPARPLLAILFSMTTVEIVYRYATAPTEQVALALAHARDVYGIRQLSFDRAARTLRIEYDATRLNAAAVTNRRAGLENPVSARACRFESDRGHQFLKQPVNSSFSSSLLRWYHLHKRDLPWRRTRDPYHILVSEVMLQQTQVQTVIPYYGRFLKAFPNFESLANASMDDVLKLWEGLGYYSRARNLHTLAGRVVQDFDWGFPSDFGHALSLPGIGRYTAGAVLSIAFEKRFPVVDGKCDAGILPLFRNQGRYL